MERTNIKWRAVLETDPETGDWAVWCPEPTRLRLSRRNIENIREAIELYLEPDPIKLEAGAILREVSVG